MKGSILRASCTSVLLGAFLHALNAPAATVVLSAVDAGFVTEVGGSAKGDGALAPGATFNYSAGRELHYAPGFYSSMLAPMDRKNYFVFDLTGIPAAITSATIALYAGPAVPPPFPMGTHGYESLDPVEVYGLAATSDMAGALADAAALKLGNAVGPSEFDGPGDPLIGVAVALYAKLAAGPVPLAAKTFSPLDDGTVAVLPFSPDGVMFLNSFAGGPIILGGKVITAMPPATPQSLFGFTGPDIDEGGPLIPMLEVTFIPEPAGATLAMIGLAVAAVFRRTACGSAEPRVSSAFK
ncbi:MAG: hypothetical protein IT424_07695 [Pirellulales bacterium]|nr:hypothetical protein [Pirellulales bacterium]